MLSVSDTYRRILNTEYITKSKLIIDGYTYDEDRIVSVKVTRKLFDNGPTIGNANSAEIELEMLKPEETFSRMAKIVLQNAISNETETSEWITTGVFYIDTRTNKHQYIGEDILEIHGYDAMMKFEQSFDIDGLSYPIDNRALLNAVCSKVGIELDDYTKNKITSSFTIDDPESHVYRDVIRYIATYFCGNFIITADEKLKLIPLNNITLGDNGCGMYDLLNNSSSISGSPDFEPYYAVYMDSGYDENGNVKRFSAYNTSKYSFFDQARKQSQALKIEDTILNGMKDDSVATRQQAVIDHIYSIISGWIYVPFETSESMLPVHVELGDKIKLNIHPDTTITSGAYSIEYEYGRIATASIKASYDEEMNKEFTYDDKGKRSSRRTESYIDNNAVSISNLNSYTGKEESGFFNDGEKITLYKRLKKSKSDADILVYDRFTKVESLIEKTGINNLGEAQTLYSKILINESEISNKVGTKGGDNSSFGWTLNSSGFYLYSNNDKVLSATSSGLTATGYISLSETIFTDSIYASGDIVSIPCETVEIRGNTVSWNSGYSNTDVNYSVDVVFDPYEYHRTVYFSFREYEDGKTYTYYRKFSDYYTARATAYITAYASVGNYLGY